MEIVTMGNDGKCVLGNLGKSWEMMANDEKQRQMSGNLGESFEIMENRGKLCEIMGNF